jgi:AraC-like DNA-binding protein
MNDPLSELLRVAGVRGSLIRRAHLHAPFGVAAPDQPRAVFHVVVTGSFHLRTGDEWHRVQPGQIVVVPRGAAHVIASSPDARSRPIDSFPVHQAPGAARALSVMHDGRLDAPDAALLCGFFALGTPADRWLLGPLPDAFVVDGGQAATAYVTATLTLLGDELRHEGLGAGLVSDRLVEVLVVHLLRSWAATQTDRPGWLGAMADPHLAPVLSDVHADLSAEWTLQRMARRAGMSRTRFVNHFRERLGTPPGQFVTDWRMAVARRALRDGASVSNAADQAGYASEAGFSRAFKRHAGVSPGAWRASA